MRWCGSTTCKTRSMLLKRTGRDTGTSTQRWRACYRDCHSTLTASLLCEQSAIASLMIVHQISDNAGRHCLQRIVPLVTDLRDIFTTQSAETGDLCFPWPWSKGYQGEQFCMLKSYPYIDSSLLQILSTGGISARSLFVHVTYLCLMFCKASYRLITILYHHSR